VAVVEGDLWAAAQASVASHRGGTLRIVDPFRPDNDPLGPDDLDVSLLQADGLVGYRRVGGAAGSALLPDLATAIPRPANAGLSYTFQLRPDLVYSNGEPVRPADFRRAIERSFQVVGGYDEYFRSISGTDACANGPETAVERCDLSKGILTDETTNTVTFILSKPDPDFVYRLTIPAAFPVPEGVPMNELVKGSFPGTGPYVVTATTADEVRMTRNADFRVWDASVRPDGFPDEIVFSVVKDDARRIAMVEGNEADYLSYRTTTRTSPELFEQVKKQYPGQWHVGSGTTRAVFMNTALSPFDNVDVRRAVNFAIDRAHVADIYGGPPDVAISCQILPPGWVGYLPYCPYTLHPDQGGRWQAPDLEAARRLVKSSGTAGAHVVLGPAFPIEPDTVLRDYLKSVLEGLGYDVTVDTETDIDKINQAIAGGGVQIMGSGWLPDFVAPSNFFSNFTCAGTSEPINYCDPEFDRAFNAALDLQTTDPSAAGAAWAALDRRAVDLGLWAPLFTEGADFLSARVGNYQFSPIGVVLFDQLWVQ
jgi:peptide/nickel transport system substrate-binding protein